MKITTKIKTEGFMSLCEGEPLFGEGTTARFGYNETATLVPVYKVKIGSLTFGGKLEVTLSFGACGPSWATEMEVDADISEDNSEIECKIEQDELLAGILLGDSLLFSGVFQASIRHSHYHWKKPHVTHTITQFKWEDSANFSLSYFIYFVGKLVTTEDLEVPKSEDLKNPFKLGLTDLSVNTFMQNGRMKVEPTFKFKYNAVKLLELIPALIPIYEMIEMLEKIGLECEFGPLVGFGTPVTLEIDEITIGENAVYKPTEEVFQNLEKFVAQRQSEPFGDLVPSEFAIKFKEKTSAAVMIGLFFETSLFKIFSREFEIKTDLIKLLGVDLGALKENFVTLEGENTNVVAQKASEAMEVVFV